MRRLRPRHPDDRRHAGDDPTGELDRFVAGSGDRLFRLAVVLSADVRAGEDLYQETLYRLALHWASVDNPEAWARRVMRNLTVDRYRARRARPFEVRLADHAHGADPGAAVGMDAAEVRPALLEALAELSAPQRLVVALRFLEDRSEAEVAALLGVPVGTVKSTSSRAVARLRRHPALVGLLPADEVAS